MSEKEQPQNPIEQLKRDISDKTLFLAVNNVSEVGFIATTYFRFLKAKDTETLKVGVYDFGGDPLCKVTCISQEFKSKRPKMGFVLVEWGNESQILGFEGTVFIYGSDGIPQREPTLEDLNKFNGVLDVVRNTLQKQEVSPKTKEEELKDGITNKNLHLTPENFSANKIPHFSRDLVNHFLKDVDKSGFRMGVYELIHLSGKKIKLTCIRSTIIDSLSRDAVNGIIVMEYKEGATLFSYTLQGDFIVLEFKRETGELLKEEGAKLEDLEFLNGILAKIFVKQRNT